ncbi:MAG TPA: 30S ribosomal protein S6 [Thermodesulfobacteriota bacterium]
MTRYELVFIVHPDRSDEDARKVLDRVKDVVASQGGEVLKVEEWGKRKLAYEIKKQSKGTYFLVHYNGTGAVLNEVERTLRISDDVLKYLTVVVDERDLAAQAAAASTAGTAPRRAGDGDEGGEGTEGREGGDGDAATPMAAAAADDADGK